MSDISKFSPDGGTTTYDIKDALGRVLQNEFGVHNLMPFCPYSDGFTTHNISPISRPNGTVRYNSSAAIDGDAVLGISAPVSNQTNTSTQWILKAGDYKLVVKTSSAMSADKKVVVIDSDNNGEIIATANSGTEAIVPFTLSSDTSILVSASFTAGQTLTNFDIQAFVILASDTNTDYLPYALSNSELTECLYKNKVADANAINNSDGRLRYYHVLGVSGNHMPTTASAYFLLDFSYAEKYTAQLALGISTENIFFRKKGNNETWPTTAPYGWHEVWDSTVHNKLYSYTYTYIAPSANPTWQDILYACAQKIKTDVLAVIPTGYIVEIESITWAGGTWNPTDITEFSSHGAVVSLGGMYIAFSGNTSEIRMITFNSEAKVNNMYRAFSASSSGGNVTNIDRSTTGSGIVSGGSSSFKIYYRVYKESTVVPTE